MVSVTASVLLSVSAMVSETASELLLISVVMSVAASVLVSAAGLDSTPESNSMLFVPTMHESPFSHPQPSPSRSASLEVHTGFDGWTAVASTMLPVTIQLSLFSQPYPSPSGSASAVWQIVRPLVSSTGTNGVVSTGGSSELVSGPIVQLSLFSQPQPSPSSSLEANRQ